MKDIVYDVKNVFTCANAEEAPVGWFGYFANDIRSLRQSVEEGKTNRKTMYNALEGVLEDSAERRFYTDKCGFKFSLFYVTDDKCNPQRY